VKDTVVGETVDRRYTLRREIASGGMGIVFEARQAYTGRAVALKLLNRDHAGNARVAERLLREARALGAVRHPNVVEVLDAGVDPDGDVYIATEMLEGRTLEGILAARGALPVWDVVHIGRQLCSALASVHAREVIHRDVKPANVFLTRDEFGVEVAKLIDFGIASLRALDKGDVRGRLTVHGEALGTPEYMAPEQLLGRETDPRCDLYGVGVTLFEALTGQLPFEGGYREQLAGLAFRTEVPSVRARRPEVPEAVAAVIERALATDPARRFPDARAMEQALYESVGSQRRASTLLGSVARVAPPAIDPRPVAVPPPASVAVEQRRKFPRAPYIAPVRMVLANDAHLDGRAEDISAGGMLVIAAQSLPPGETVRVRFALPGSGTIVTVPATVRWVKSARAGRVALGLEFLEIDEAPRRAISLYVTLTGTGASAE
jgi:serine/threonine-protein kinase